MKNKLYVSLFAVVASGAVTVSVIGTGRDGHGVEQIEPKIEMQRLKKGASEYEIIPKEQAETMLGSNKATYAPSEDELFLRKASQKLNDIANGLAQLRQNDLEVFNKYFGEEGADELASADESEVLEDRNDDQDEEND